MGKYSITDFCENCGGPPEVIDAEDEEAAARLFLGKHCPEAGSLLRLDIDVSEIDRLPSGLIICGVDWLEGIRSEEEMNWSCHTMAFVEKTSLLEMSDDEDSGKLFVINRLFYPSDVEADQ